MKCKKCVEECQGEGGLCSPPPEDHADYYQQWMYDQDAEHQNIAHRMILIDGFYRCLEGHRRVEAPPAEAMRAAGIPPLL